MAVLGPDVPPLGIRRDVNVTTSQIAATIASLVGEDYRAAVSRRRRASSPEPLTIPARALLRLRQGFGETGEYRVSNVDSIPPVMRSRLTLPATVAALIVSLATLSSQVPAEKTIYVVSTAHLDSQWNWTVQDTIRDYLPKTLRTNFEFFEKYPNYVFNWEGAIHYMWMKEYYPDDWATLQKYVAAGRWRAVGIVDQRRGREHAVAGVAVPACALRPAVLPRGVQQSQPRHLSCPIASASGSRSRRSRRSPV